MRRIGLEFDIKEELKKLPNKPGVYVMKDENGAVIYVGKAVNLHSRVRSYFQTSSVKHERLRVLSGNIDSFEYFVTDSEIEALVLECNLIKRHNPKYNIKLKDDKAYPYIKVTVNERLPRIIIARDRGRDRAKYYGPYMSGERVREIIGLIHDIWPIRKCQRVFPRDYDKERPCLNHHIGKCMAPCNRLIGEDEYKKFIIEAERFIQGKTEEVALRLAAEMAECAEELQFERAAELRDL
ncbi:MAG: GIY-YIG nuclease family protein, partial [Defluviitaleaceae bacterium]|nr:GIY-YIG nuclease family protein [Defluviitaleaceae bacterium]